MRIFDCFIKLFNLKKKVKENPKITCMRNFVFKRQPKGYQGSKKFKSNAARDSYINGLEKAFKQSNPAAALITGDLYGVVYYFQKKHTGTDADNISKLIWDCLKGIVFKDDQQIKLRTAGIVDISKGDLNVIDFTNVRGEIIAELIEAFDTADHFTYIECGLLNKSMYKFNLEEHYGN
ncbi:MAG: RusA family crossover junction endodeoxyribonuclease [Endomicrobia bacterium]|nr:RusA family crossover junction endodeoxyribonuclease [Endomicrobiia bacterium]